jgi:serine/threonine-protein phosphatase 5
MNARDGFAKELREKCSGDQFISRYFGEIFRWLPLAHLIEGRVLVVHGGLSANPELRLDDIRRIK